MRGPEMMLETERLMLRNWQESDLEHYLTLASDVGYHCFTRPGRFMVQNAKEARARVRERMLLFDRRKLGKFPIFLKKTELKKSGLKETEEFIGTCGIEPFNLEGQPEVELGYRLCLKSWGKGYAKEAATAVLKYGFDDLRLPKIMAFVLPQNRASVRILEQLGFQYLRNFVHAELVHRLYDFPQGLRGLPSQSQAVGKVRMPG
jgi:[ribosomal protein S5]-alanine N-acetyltransferase